MEIEREDDADSEVARQDEYEDPPAPEQAVATQVEGDGEGYLSQEEFLFAEKLFNMLERCAATALELANRFNKVTMNAVYRRTTGTTAQ